MAAIEPGSSVVIIGRMLSPAFMINAAALLLLSLHNKFSTQFARIRALNAERRSLRVASVQADEERLANVSHLRDVHTGFDAIRLETPDVFK